MPVLVICIVQVGHQWGHILLHAEIPKYLHSVHDFDIAHVIIAHAIHLHFVYLNYVLIVFRMDGYLLSLKYSIL
jgi:hypothetical protein